MIVVQIDAFVGRLPLESPTLPSCSVPIPVALNLHLKLSVGLFSSSLNTYYVLDTFLSVGNKGLHPPRAYVLIGKRINKSVKRQINILHQVVIKDLRKNIREYVG